MTKLIIDERDLRCTILEGVRELLKRAPWTVTSDEEKAELARPLIEAVIACGDKPSPKTALDQLEQMIGRMMTTPMRAPARAQLLVEMLTIVNQLRVPRERDACPICDFGEECERALEVVRYSCGHWLKRKSRVHTDCFRMPGGTAPCACLDGCGSCDSCGLWLGGAKHQPRVDESTHRLLGCACGFACTTEGQLTEHVATMRVAGEGAVPLEPDDEGEPNA